MSHVLTPRPASTVLALRDGVLGYQVLMLRRNLNSDFVGGAYVFPGGAVDPLDGGTEAEALCAGRTEAGASALLGFESGGLAYWVAVVRETFEEAGILLARRQDGTGILAGDRCRHCAGNRNVWVITLKNPSAE